MQSRGWNKFRGLRVDCPPASPHPTCLTCGAPHNGVVLVHSLKELPNDEGHRLDPLHLLLSIEVLCTKVLELILDIVLLNLQYMYITTGNQMM